MHDKPYMRGKEKSERISILIAYTTCLVHIFPAYNMNESEKFARQISIWGTEHQEILMGSNICMLGSGLIILEVAKGLMLSGIANFSIVDNERIGVEYSEYTIFPSGDINAYKCEIVKNNLMRINRDAKINCIMENPMHYFFDIVLKDDRYDIIICNLSVKNNITVERWCKHSGRKVITCHACGMLAYLNVCMGNHIYMGIDNNKKEDFIYHYCISISLYSELKKCIHNMGYPLFCVNNTANKVLFLIKCYTDFCMSKEESNKKYFLQFIKEKVTLTSLKFHNMEKVEHIFFELTTIVERIKSLLKNKERLMHNNHICLFLVVYKSFVKKKKKLPFLHDIHFDDSTISTIVMKRKIKDKEEIDHLIGKKKKKYNFEKRFDIFHFSYFFSNFFFIENVKNGMEKWKDDMLINNFFDFSYLYSLSFEEDHIDSKDNVSRKGSCFFFPKSDCFHNEREDKKLHYSHHRPNYNRRISELLLCNYRKDILNFPKNVLLRDVNKEGIVRESYALVHTDFPFLFNEDDIELRYLGAFVDTNINVLLEKVKKMKRTFHCLREHRNSSNKCASLVVSGLVTQETLKYVIVRELTNPLFVCYLHAVAQFVLTIPCWTNQRIVKSFFTELIWHHFWRVKNVFRRRSRHKDQLRILKIVETGGGKTLCSTRKMRVDLYYIAKYVDK
ncbi:ubiquitin-activating enzyme E1, putative [Plasmodium ovale curtisi]|uniref:Ubiquitin-activating enzyme E1, putative n=1 Tax=Plasmodium ovale curtisi TaxID=864141 RepID=A0A1A8WVT7_PLAOA|nr:ubiquitin-activating enzyme E1, putative [Plasmodium ovale curtisi]